MFKIRVLDKGFRSRFTGGLSGVWAECVPGCGHLSLQLLAVLFQAHPDLGGPSSDVQVLLEQGNGRIYAKRWPPAAAVPGHAAPGPSGPGRGGGAQR